MKIDVAVCTYNSEKYMDKCLEGIEQAFDVNNLIVVDHHSTDRTIEIAKSHGANIYFEDQGFAYALNLGIDKARTDIFAIIDSDVVLEKGRWVSLLSRKFDDPKIGGVGLRMFSDEPLWRKEYCAYYFHVKDFRQIRGGDWVNAYVIRKKALGPHFHIPNHLKSYNHIYMKDTIIRNGYKTSYVNVDGTHYYDFHLNKGFWMGAGERSYFGLRNFPVIVVRRVLLSPVKAVPPAIAYDDPNVIFGNTSYWFDFLKGYLRPQKHLHMKRGRAGGNQ